MEVLRNWRPVAFSDVPAGEVFVSPIGSNVSEVFIRAAMNTEECAVALGPTFAGYKGKGPGVVREAVFRNRPVLLVEGARFALPSDLTEWHLSRNCTETLGAVVLTSSGPFLGVDRDENDLGRLYVSVVNGDMTFDLDGPVGEIYSWRVEIADTPFVTSPLTSFKTTPPH